MQQSMQVHMQVHVRLECRPDLTRPDLTRSFFSSYGRLFLTHCSALTTDRAREPLAMTRSTGHKPVAASCAGNPLRTVGSRAEKENHDG